LEVPL
jgi:hypothetical protein